MFIPKGYQQISDLSTAVGLTVPDGARYALIVAEGGEIRWRDDGTDPTAAVGMPVADNGFLWYEGELESLRLFSTLAAANISYYR